jgi:hypothetical protein
VVVTDGSGERTTTYQVPMTYRGRACADASGGLIGTSEHGVLGLRWIYDGTCDPVLVAQLVAAIQGEAEPQAQSVSNTPDPTVTSQPVTDGSLTVAGPAVAASGPYGTDLRIQTARANGTPAGQLSVRINRVLLPDGGGAPIDRAAPAGDAGQPCLFATWRQPDGTRARGVFATAQYAPVPAK